ncbi:hypothetical protein [Anaerospora sp.]|jgi:hypothetical protein|uniref:hypothetical protein n=1 Tax=Anaerospora sp. TaxID=1960278 RepID=UPI00289DBC8D|nr:hypothetical protein [Anaerospora sp.]
MKQKVTAALFALMLVPVPSFADSPSTDDMKTLIPPQAINTAELTSGNKTVNADAIFGRQPLIVGEGMFIDINGMKGIYMGPNKSRFHAIGFVGQPNEASISLDTIALDIGTTVSGIDVGVGYIKANDIEDSKYWSFNAGTKVSNNVTLSGSYMKNDNSTANGYLVQATFGKIEQKGDINYAVSYRDVEDRAVNSNWVNTEAYANSKGFRATANYKVTENGTLSLYQDFTTRHDDETVKPNQFRAEFNVIF